MSDNKDFHVDKEILKELSVVLDDKITSIVQEQIKQYMSGIPLKNQDVENKIKESIAAYGNDIDFDDYTINTTLGDYLKENGITQTWLAEKTKINRGTIINIINNPHTATLLNVRKICAILNKSSDELFLFVKKADL